MNPEQLIAVARPGQERELALGLAAQGVPTLLVQPGAKTPLDPRPLDMRNGDDEAAAYLAKAAGDPNWHAVKSAAGVHLGTTDPLRINTYFDVAQRRWAGDQINLALRLTGKDVVVVDADNAENVTAFQDTFRAVTGRSIEPTVMTPGVVSGEGWKHKGGAHFYLSLPPNVDLPLTDWTHAQGGWTVMIKDRYVLIPPSSRPEGSYTWTGAGAVPCPPELLAVLTERVQQDTAYRMSREAARLAFASGQMRDVDAWSAGVSWGDLLTPDGWTEYKSASCGCATWTGPGGHTNPLTAIGHDAGCSSSRIDTSRGSGPLVIFSTRLPEVVRGWCEQHGVRSMTKLQYLSASWNMPPGWVCKRLGMRRPPI